MKSPCPDVGIYRCIRAVESIIDADNAPPSEPPFPMRVLKIIPALYGCGYRMLWVYFCIPA